MRRDELTEKILDVKRSEGWSWRHITEEIGGVSPILVVGALLGQMKLVKPLAKKAAALFGLSEDEERMLNEVPNRGTPMPPTDPLIYRFYELVMVNGPAWKARPESRRPRMYALLWPLLPKARLRSGLFMAPTPSRSPPCV
jgi:cyanate lyase